MTFLNFQKLPAKGPVAVTGVQLEEFHQSVAKAEDPGDVAHQLREFARYRFFYLFSSVSYWT